MLFFEKEITELISVACKKVLILFVKSLEEYNDRGIIITNEILKDELDFFVKTLEE